MKNKTPESLAAARAYQKAYRSTPEGKAYYETYRRDPAVMAAKAAYKRKIKETPEGKLTYQKYSFKNSLKSYGLTVDDWHRMIIEQSGRCALCVEPMNPTIKEPCVDHCHTTGRVRSLLCNNCNLGLGHFKESEERLQLAIEYLRQF